MDPQFPALEADALSIRPLGLLANLITEAVNITN